MKQNIKIFLIALVIGAIVCYIVCIKFNKPLISNALSTKATYFYVGTYNNLEDASLKQQTYSNSVIYNDNGIYKVVIGIYTNSNSKDLMASFFLDKNINFQIGEIKITGEFITQAENYELLIISSNKEYYENLNNSLLKVFNEYIN